MNIFTFIWLIYLFPHYFRWRPCRYPILTRHHTLLLLLHHLMRRLDRNPKSRNALVFVDFLLLVLLPRWIDNDGGLMFSICMCLTLLSCGLPFYFVPQIEYDLQHKLIRERSWKKSVLVTQKSNTRCFFLSPIIEWYNKSILLFILVEHTQLRDYYVDQQQRANKVLQKLSSKRVILLFLVFFYVYYIQL